MALGCCLRRCFQGSIAHAQQYTVHLRAVAEQAAAIHQHVARAQLGQLHVQTLIRCRLVRREFSESLLDNSVDGIMATHATLRGSYSVALWGEALSIARGCWLREGLRGDVLHV